jgi:hypothetical protein
MNSILNGEGDIDMDWDEIKTYCEGLRREQKDILSMARWALGFSMVALAFSLARCFV